jgi:hypothetical protein
VQQGLVAGPRAVEAGNLAAERRRNNAQFEHEKAIVVAEPFQILFSFFFLSCESSVAERIRSLLGYRSLGF